MNLRTIAATLIAAAGIAAFAAGPAVATEPIESFSTTTSTSDAGGHPDLVTSFRLESPGDPESARNVIFNAPEGVFGNPNAITQCPQAAFALTSCPSNSQAGIATIRASHNGDPNSLLGTAPVYSLVPGENQTALFALVVPTLNIPINIPVEVRTGSDYGLRFTVSEISQSSPLRGVDLTLWGFPAIDIHNTQRFAKGSPGNPSSCPLLSNTSCISSPVSSSDPPHPLISNPTVCTGQPLITRLSVQTYQDPSNLSESESSYPPVTRCEREKFNPVIRASTTTDETDSASGLDLLLRAPQFLSFAASPSQIRSVTVTLPPGLTVNPDAADGQTACTEDEANFGRDNPAACPDSSKIGTFEIGTPALDGPLTGSLYIGEPKPNNQYRVFMIANGFGINAKLVSSFFPDPATGQVTIQTQDLPQVAFEEFALHLFSSDRAILASPTHCTLYPVAAKFFPWNDKLPDQTSTQFIGFGSGPGGSPCPGPERPFNPRIVAGTSNANAGAFSNFHLKLDRDDGDQFLGDLNFTMPPGLTGSLRGINYCPEAAIAHAAANPGRTELVAQSCPASSAIGTSNVAAGPGTHPFHAIGRVYLAGPLNGAPLSLAVVTPALAGPYDYGTIVVRVALHVDTLDAHVVAVSDRVPQIVGGIPIRMRSIQVNLDRPNFTINPTNCSPLAITSQGIGDQGALADFSSYFNAVNCTTMAFRPKMAVRQLGGRKATKRAKNPTLQFDLWTRSGDANIRSLAVTLSSAFQIDQRHLGNICSEKELAINHCAGRQAIGSAWTKTPLLDEPLSGPVYAVSGSGGLPRLAFILGGQVTLIPRAESKTVKSRLMTTVPVVPDAPIGHFRLLVFGGKRGYLSNTRDLCKHQPLTTVSFSSQSDATYMQRVRMRTACAKGHPGAAGSTKHRDSH